MNTKNLVVALGLLACPAASALAQPTVQAVIGASVDRLDRGTTATDASSSPAGTFSLDHQALDERLRLYYAFDGGTYSSEGDWHYLQHTAGASYRFALGPRSKLFVGGTAALRANGDSWSTANYRAGGLFGNLEHALGRGVFRTGVRADRRAFADQPDLDHWETGAFASARLSFQTRTTLIAEASLGWKRFDGGAMWLDASPVTDHTPPATSGQGTGGVQAGQGNGLAGGGTTGSAGTTGGASTAGGRWLRPTVLAASTRIAAGGEQARQLTLFGRLAQSLTDRLALTFEVTRRDAAGAVAPALVTTPEMLIDDGVYDDPFASDATVVRLGLKRVFDGGRTVDGGLSHWSKTYEATPAFDLAGTADAGRRREDDVWRVEASWLEPLAPGRTGNVDLAVIGAYTFMDSSSTDAFYTYRAHRVRAMLSIGF